MYYVLRIVYDACSNRECFTNEIPDPATDRSVAIHASSSAFFSRPAGSGGATIGGDADDFLGLAIREDGTEMGTGERIWIVRHGKLEDGGVVYFAQDFEERRVIGCVLVLVFLSVEDGDGEGVHCRLCKGLSDHGVAAEFGAIA